MVNLGPDDVAHISGWWRRCWQRWQRRSLASGSCMEKRRLCRIGVSWRLFWKYRHGKSNSAQGLSLEVPAIDAASVPA
jgi:hypothetical protein